MKRLIALFSIFASAAAWAEPTVLRASELGWEARFDAPATSKVEESSSATAYRYLGNAGRFNLSLAIEPPVCRGGGSPREQFDCFFGRMEKIPGLVSQSVKVKKANQGVLISYVAYAPVDGANTKIMHVHILFADKGLWGDLHGSVIKPEAEDSAMLLSLGSSFSYSK